MKSLLIAAALVLGTSPAALAQPAPGTATQPAALAQPAPGTATQPAVPALNSGEEVDSGVGATDPQSFVGRVAVSADGREIGPVRAAEMASDTSDGGLLVVEHGGRMLRLPASGASVSGDRVTVSSTFDRATAN